MPVNQSDRSREAAELLEELLQLREQMLNLNRELADELAQLHPTFQLSGHNLMHYLALRQRDLRPLQQRLAALGLSSLGRAEGHTLATLDSVIATLSQLCQQQAPELLECPGPGFQEGGELLTQHTNDLLEQTPEHRGVRIMVTMPSEAAWNQQLIRDLLERGMNCMRINCAHDDKHAWRAMLDNLQAARQETGKSCLVQMDLAGPKLRTGTLAPGPEVLHIQPKRDAFGRVLKAARIRLEDSAKRPAQPGSKETVVVVSADWLAQLQAGDSLKLMDARGADRSLQVLQADADGVVVSCDRSTYLRTGCELKLTGRGLIAGVTELPAQATAIDLDIGDTLIVTRDQRPGSTAINDETGHGKEPAHIGCTLPEVFDSVAAGEPILFDDGRIAGRIRAVHAGQIEVEISRATARLRADKGINLPASEIKLNALTEKDREDLGFVVQHADLIGLSFVNRASDVRTLQQEIGRLGDRRPGIVLKIETRRGFENLPSILLAAMRSARVGVMIARGDLAVECGFGRLAEAQEEMLWICEAAHIPIIWATQVLEQLAKKGIPTRAEITDAAMSHRAECVMLNKGAHILAAVETLDHILQVMQSHQLKKQSMLRELHLAHHLREE